MSTPTGIVRLERRAQLLRAAAELFAEHGYATTSIDAIGARAGISGPAVYRHFSSKNHLLLTLLGDAVNTALLDVEDKSLEALVRQVVRYSIDQRRVTGLLYAQHGTLAAVERKQIEALRLRVRTTWAKALRAARPDLPEEEVLLHVGAAIAVLSTISRQLPKTLSGNEDATYVRILMGLLMA